MEIGDTIYNKDLPSIHYKITGFNKKWDMWRVKLITPYLKGITVKSGLVDKFDDRWEILKP